MAHLALALLGPFQARLDGKPAEGLNSIYLRALLAYLAVESRREHSREQVAALLWPERSDQEALSALRFALSKLHAALGDRQADSPCLLITRSHVHFNPTSDHWLDVAEFQNLARGSDVPSLEQAAALYRGPFLDGLSLADSPAFEEWMLLKGEEIHRSLLALLDRLTSLQLRAGETGEAARWARRQLELEPYREQAHRQLMRALALGGERATALAHFDSCRRLLAEELGCEPEDETQALIAQIRDGSLPQIQSTSLILSESLMPGLPSGEAIPDTRFVSRQGELAKLKGLLDHALAGLGGVALISGEAGDGKTALLDEFSRQAGLAHPDLIALRGRCNAHGGEGDPFLPFREMLQSLAGDVESKRAGGTLSPEQARRIWQALPAVGAALVEHGPDLIDRFLPGEALYQRLESISTPASAARWLKRLREILARSPDGAASPQPDLFAQVTQVLRTLSARTPLLLAIDDLQWADGGTAALLFHLGRRLAGSRILLICAYRPQAAETTQGSPVAEPDVRSVLGELKREWGDVLVDLERADGQAFVEALIDSEPNRLGEDFRQRLYGHTGGNPLFTVELLHSFERQGMLVKDEDGRWVEAAELDWDYCPPQVEAVIAGHLSELTDEDQELLQTAAVQGEQFAAEVTARVLGKGDEAVLQRLSGPLRRQHRLVEAVRLERLSSSGQSLSHYRFRHALLQRGAYSRLDTVRQSQLHEATGQALEALYAVEAEKPQFLAPMLAWHYEIAGLRLEAARALHEAGSQAAQLSAFREALNLFDRGLALLGDEPPSVKRKEIQRLLEAARLVPQLTVGGPGGMGVADSLKSISREELGEIQGRPGLMMILAEAERVTAQGHLDEGLAVTGRLLDQATREGEEIFVAMARHRFGFVHHLLGNLRESEAHYEWVFGWLTPRRSMEMYSVTGFDVEAASLSVYALVEWWLGRGESALRRSKEAVSGACERGFAYGQVYAAAFGALTLFLLRSDPALIREWAELCHRVGVEHGFEWWQAWADVLLGRLAVMEGAAEAGIERQWNAIQRWQGFGLVVLTDHLVAVLADGCLAAARQRPESNHAETDAGRLHLLRTGLSAIDLVLRPPELSCGKAFHAELHRLRGELLLERDGLAAADEAFTCFQQSLQLGREMGALSWELRAAMSIVRLCIRQGEAYAAKLVEARACLRDVYAPFKEGFDFSDLQEAAALMDETV